MTPRTDPARHRRTLAAAALSFASGDVERADQLLTGALAHAASDRERAELLIEQGRVGFQRDQTRAAAALREALGLVGDDAALRVDVLVHLGSTVFSLGRLGDAVAYTNEAVRFANDTADTGRLAMALSASAFFDFHVTGEVPHSKFRRAIALEEAAGAGPSGEWSALAEYGVVLLDAWILDPARDIFERLVARARINNSATLAQHLDDLAYVELCDGNLIRAMTFAQEAVDIASQTGRATTEVHALSRLGWIEGLRGDIDSRDDRASAHCDSPQERADPRAAHDCHWATWRVPSKTMTQRGRGWTRRTL